MWATLAAVAFGFLLGCVRNMVGSWRTRSNLRWMLFRELKHNFRRLNKAAPKKEGAIPPFEVLAKVLREKYPDIAKGVVTQQWDIPPPGLLAEVCDTFSFSAYDRYFDRIASLKKKEVDKIYDAYYIMRETLRDARPVLEVPLHSQTDYRQKRQYIDHAGSLISMCEDVLKAVSDALRVFRGGEETIKELESQRGLLIEAYRKGSEKLSQALDGMARSS